MRTIFSKGLDGRRARRTKTPMQRLGLAAVLSCALTVTSCVTAESRAGAGVENYPQRPITVLVGFSAGSATDVLARKILAKVEADTGWSVIVENQDGASGSVALGSLKSRAADGYTLLFSGGSLAFTAGKDLSSGAVQGVKVVAKQATALAVNSKSRYDELDDLISATKGNGSEVAMGLPGALNYNTADMYQFSQEAQLDARWVPFDSGSDLASAMLGNQIDAAAASPVNFVSGVESGQLRMLAVTGGEKIPSAPDVPTFREEGYKIPASQWYAFAASSRVPDKIVEKFSAAIDEALESKPMQAYYKQQGLQPVNMDVGASRDFVSREAKKAVELIPTLSALFKG